MDTLIEFDTWLLLTVNSWNTEIIDPVMKAFSGRGVWIPLYVSIAALIFWRYGWRRGLLIVASTGIAVGCADYVCASVIRPLVQRLRPSNLENEISAMVHIVNGYRSGAYGFPSCHAANTFALAVYTTLVMRESWYAAFIFGWAVLQCYSRVYLGVHYPGDLLVGACIGALIAWLVYLPCSRNSALRTDLNPKAKAAPVWIVGAATCVYICLVSWIG